MNRSLAALVAVVAVLVAACGSPTSTTTIAAQPTTTSAEPVTSSTTSAPEPSTTAAPTTTGATTTTGEPSENASELDALHTAFAASAAITSGRMEGLIEMTGLDPSTTGLTELSMPFGGAFDNVSGNFSFYLDMSGLAAAAGDEMPPEFADLFGEMEVRQIGDRAYMRFAFLNMFLGAETEWIAMPADESGTATQDFTMSSPSNPSEFLATFEDAGATVEVLGTETVNGVQATHYRAVFDTEALLASATPEERAKLEAQGPLPADFLPLDVWVSDEGLVVRFVMEIDGTGLATTPEESFDKMTMRYDLFDLNGDVTIEAPPVANTTDIEDLDGFSF
jgi:hypothetical protein